MPIFQEPDPEGSYPLWPAGLPVDYGHSAHLITNPNVVGACTWDLGLSGTSPVDSEMENYSPAKLQTSDREELIRCIKRGETPTWVPNYSLGDYAITDGPPSHSWVQGLQKIETPAPQSMSEAKQGPDSKEALVSPAEIERPRSALHSGDFREGCSDIDASNLQQTHPIFGSQQDSTAFGPLGSSPTTPWFNPSLPLFPKHNESGLLPEQPVLVPRSQAPSLGSFPSSYILKAPTSPLVYQATNTDFNSPPNHDRMDFPPVINENARRRTLPPETFRQFQASPPTKSQGISFTRPYPPPRRDGSCGFQAHQPRRSLTSTYTLQLASSPQTPYRSRRPSFATDTSPLLHAPMVGSYEESILRGRMSITPSKPLDFTAQIGVLGKGKCKANLRCPPHVTVPFPAVFYSYPASGNGRSIADDSPSPYVGLIDLENSLTSEGANENRRRGRRHSPGEHIDHSSDEHGHIQARRAGKREPRKREKKFARPDSLKAPPGGCYRIPQHGQLQIVIKNPNKTAVKLFLVPYDLGGMEPGTKTFIRQRSYSTGPVIDMPLTTPQNLPATSLKSIEGFKDKPTLRYLIHLNICCPSRGRFYLYSTVRVVFANRVPDGKEKLRNEIQYPEPRYSPYRPAKEAAINNVGTRLMTGKSFRRRNSGPGLIIEDHLLASDMTFIRSPYLHSCHVGSASRVDAIPFQLSPILVKKRALPDSDFSPSNRSQLRETSSPRSPGARDVMTPAKISYLSSPSNSGSPQTNLGGNNDLYSKLSKGDVGYGGFPFGSLSGGSDGGESLLAKELRGLDVKIPKPPSS